MKQGRCCSISSGVSGCFGHSKRKLSEGVAVSRNSSKDHNSGGVQQEQGGKKDQRGTQRNMESILKPIRDGESVLDLSPRATVSGGVEDIYGEDRATEDQLVTPWTISVARLVTVHKLSQVFEFSILHTFFT